MTDTAAPNPTEVAVFGGGCFWCTEAVFAALRGVKSVMPGYTGGTVANPTYGQVSSGTTGHIESAKIEFDPLEISYDDLLAVFFNTHDPTTRDRQGADVGTQYRSAIFFSDDTQKQKAEALIKELNDSHAYDKPVVTEVRPLGEFYSAEDYHREYYAHHKNDPYCELIIAPKMEKLQKRFAALLRQDQK